MATIINCDYSNPDHANALAALVNEYIKDEMGGGAPLSIEDRSSLIDGLRSYTKAIVLLAQTRGNFVGMLIAFENFSTFSARPMINVHDVFIEKKHRGKGIGRQLMNLVINEARNRKCSRITLEVRKDNFAAQNLYIDLGFDEADPEMFYWRKDL